MKKTAGIYKIVNLINEKIYVGSSINLKSRKYDHFRRLELGKHENNHLQNSYNKYKKENFKWEVIEYIEVTGDKELDKGKILEREQYWIDVLNVCDRNLGYNICEKAGSNLGRRLSESAKYKISLANKGKKLSQETLKRRKETLKNRTQEEKDVARSNLSNSLKERNFKHSEETKKKISIANKGNKNGKYTRGSKRTEEQKKKLSEAHKGYSPTDEARNNMSLAQKKRKRTLNEINLFKERMSKLHKGKVITEEMKELIKEKLNIPVINITTGEVFRSVKEAGIKCKIKNNGNISLVCKGKRKTAGGYMWKYLKEVNNV